MILSGHPLGIIVSLCLVLARPGQSWYHGAAVTKRPVFVLLLSRGRHLLTTFVPRSMEQPPHLRGQEGSPCLLLPCRSSELRRSQPASQHHTGAGHPACRRAGGLRRPCKLLRRLEPEGSRRAAGRDGGQAVGSHGHTGASEGWAGTRLVSHFLRDSNFDDRMTYRKSFVFTHGENTGPRAERPKGEDWRSWGAVGPEAAAPHPGEQQTSSKVPEALRPALPV